MPVRLALMACVAGLVGCRSVSMDSTIIVVRHAHKDTAAADRRDPPLSEHGQRHAELLARALRDAGVKRVLVSDLRRTRATAAPLVESDPRAVLADRPAYSAADSPDAIAGAARDAAVPGGAVLLVAHSNHVPGILRALGGWEVPALTEQDYEFLFIVTLHADGSRSLIRAGYPPSAD